VRIHNPALNPPPVCVPSPREDPRQDKMDSYCIWSEDRDEEVDDVPMATAPKNETNAAVEVGKYESSKRNLFSKEEDRLLLKIIDEVNVESQNWPLVSSKMQDYGFKRSAGSLKGRWWALKSLDLPKVTFTELEIQTEPAVSKPEKRWKDMNDQERLQYNRYRSHMFRKRRQAAGISTRGDKKPTKTSKDNGIASSKLKGPKFVKDDVQSRLNAEKTMKCYYRKKARQAAGPVKNLVADVIANILKQAHFRDRTTEQIKRQNAVNKERKKTDIGFKSVHNLRTRLRCALRARNENSAKCARTMNLIGTSREKLGSHLQSTLDGRTGKLNIDHVFPFYSYDMKDPASQWLVMNWSNTQLLTQEENYQKHTKLPTKAMAAKVERNKWPPGITEDMLPDIYPGWATPLRMHAAPTPGASSSTDTTSVVDELQSLSDSDNSNNSDSDDSDDSDCN
jgi:hypothetical protein